MSNKSTKKSEVSSRDADFMFAVVKHSEGNPKINWEGVAQDMGLKNSACASARFGQIKKKFNNSGGFGSGSGDSPSKVTKRGRPAKAAAGKTKAPKTPKKKKQQEVKEESDDHSDEVVEVAEENDDDSMEDEN